MSTAATTPRAGAQEERGTAASAPGVRALRLAGAEERARLAEWGGSGRPAEPPRPVHHLFAEQARLRPGAAALSCGGATLTYAELDARAERLADRLAAAGVGPEAVVAVHAARSAGLVAALLGVLKAGGCYLGIEPGTPPQRVRSLLEHARARAVLADADLAAQHADTAIPVLALDGGDGGEPAPRRREVPVYPENLAYVSYTSGSTGAPRGVSVPHAAVARLARGPDWASFGPDDVVLHLSPVAFDASTLEIWGALLNGARVAVHPAGPVLPDQVADTLRREGVTVLWLTAGLFQRMVDAEPGAFAGVRHLLAGGDVVSPAHLERLLHAHPRLRFTNGYGPTENTTFTTCWTADGVPSGGALPIGRPVRGTRVAVLDAGLRPVPAGAPGELCASGAGLARGYLGAPRETAERFVPDPAPERPGERTYRTGDRVRWRPDGTLDFLGRIDQQVKVQGYRVEPGEVQAVLARHPGVREAVVVTDALRDGGVRLLAYVVPALGRARGAGDLAQAVRAWAREQLPPYMVPRLVIPVDALPLGPNGKVDRAALPEAARAGRQLRTGYASPRNEVEAYLAGVWGELLSIEPVGIHDDFFALGGHSLLAAELFTAVESGLGVDVPARTVYVQPTIAALAATIQEARERDGAAPAPEPG